MTRVHRWLACIALAVAAGGCRAAFKNGSEPEVIMPQAHFLEQNYVFYPSEPKGLLYEAQAAANIVIAQTIARAGSDVRNDMAAVPEWHYAHMAVFTPNFVIRQLQDSSAAVRTPSFNPKVTYQTFRLRKRADPGAGPNVNKWKWVDLQMTDFVFAHYSNGQAGCFYEDERFTRVGDRIFCLRPQNDTGPRAINFSDGSFSTWYLRAGVGGERMWGFGGDDAPETSHVAALISLQYNIPFLTEKPQRPLYGDWRVRGQAEYEKLLPIPGGFVWRFAGAIEQSLDAGPSVPRTGWSVETALTSERAFGFGPFVRYYSGQDYYNIAFVNTLVAWQAGIMIKLDRRDIFRR